MSFQAPLSPPPTPRIKKGIKKWVENFRSSQRPKNMHRNTDVRIVIPNWVIKDNDRTMSLLIFIKTSLKSFYPHFVIISSKTYYCYKKNLYTLLQIQKMISLNFSLILYLQTYRFSHDLSEAVQERNGDLVENVILYFSIIT